MPCTSVSYEAMAQAGWSEEELELLRKEIRLATETAKATSFANGDTLSQQQRAAELAEAEARSVAHDRFHAKLEAMMSDLNRMNAWKIAHPEGDYDTRAKLGSEVAVPVMSGRHLGKASGN